MRDNTYDIPAYKFALVKFEYDILGECKDRNTVKNYVVNNPSLCYCIPFENFDGSTVEELKPVFCQRHNNFYFVCYNSFSYTTRMGGMVNQYNILFSLLLLDLGMEERIDEVIKNYMINNYKICNAEAQRVFRCFLERYCYRSQDEVTNEITRVRKPADTNKENDTQE